MRTDDAPYQGRAASEYRTLIQPLDSEEKSRSEVIDKFLARKGYRVSEDGRATVIGGRNPYLAQ